MTLALRRAAPDDYDVIQTGEIIGRILRMNSTAPELWLWTQIGWAHLAGWPTSQTTEGNVGISRPADR